MVVLCCNTSLEWPSVPHGNIGTRTPLTMLLHKPRSAGKVRVRSRETGNAHCTVMVYDFFTVRLSYPAPMIVT